MAMLNDTCTSKSVAGPAPLSMAITLPDAVEAAAPLGVRDRDE
jgi:hypothetical protein